MTSFFLICILGIFGCDRSIHNNNTTEPNNSPIAAATPTPEQPLSDADLPPSKSVFTPTDAIVVFQWDEEVIKQAKGLIYFYDDTGAVWHVVNYFDDSMESMSEPGGKFRPFSFRVGNFRLKMQCTGKSANWYEVIVEEEVDPKVKKYVRADDPLLKLQSWEEYVLSFYNVKFDQKVNPILKTPAGKPRNVDTLSNDIWRVVPVKVRGEWLMIRWEKTQNKKSSTSKVKPHTQANFGWIRWRKGGEFYISDFYP